MCLENRKRIIELLTEVRYTTNDIEKVADKICSLFNVVGKSEQLKPLEDLKDFAYDNCQPHNSDKLSEIMERL
jgi:hypothetical protein